ncbi:hypothetical protein CDG81_13045 [Actinopolyspora erythraea]|uniref:Cas3 C-terminal domain-containing protein n=1 Tax=Actinopolyspora erythraea TaxID=414996 RepID=A0A099D570_9ACTN|nr:hypothetical protein [Actinopolyspora erythraea]ASU79058.1 hypothetical protein CDG81_13045 [Actinopolyspora erythraea]KGI81184.1 hypothetical protein IL38_13150 [Actinopolyspora erythraea]
MSPEDAPEADEAFDIPIEATVNIVPVWRTDSGELRSRRGVTVDPEAETLDEELVLALADSTVTLSAPVDLSPHALAVLREQLPLPPAFDRSGVLRGHQLLELDAQGRAVVDEVTIRHHATFGLLVRDRGRSLE